MKKVLNLVKPIMSENLLLLIRKISKEKIVVKIHIFEYIFLKEIQKYFHDVIIDYTNETSDQKQNEQMYDFIDYFKLILSKKFSKAFKRLNKYLKKQKVFPISVLKDIEKLNENDYLDIINKFPFDIINNVNDHNCFIFLENERILEIYINIYSSILLSYIKNNYDKGLEITFPEILPNLSNNLYTNCYRKSLIYKLNKEQIILLTNKLDCLFFLIKKIYPKSFTTIINSRNILETFLNFINLNLVNSRYNEELVYMKYNNIFKKLNAEVFFKTLIMLVNLSKSNKKKEIFSYILSRKVCISHLNIITTFNIFDLSNISGEKCHDLIKFLFSKPYKNSNPYIYFENLFQKMTTLFLSLSKKKEKESDNNIISRLNGLNNLILLILREVITTHINDHFLIYLLFHYISSSFLKRINCELTYNIKSKNIEMKQISNNNRLRNLNIILSNFLRFYFSLEDIFRYNFCSFLINDNIFFCLMKLNYELDQTTKIIDINISNSSLHLINDFKHFLKNIFTAINEDIISEKIVKFYLYLVKINKNRLIEYCKLLPKLTNIENSFYDYNIHLDKDVLKINPIKVNILNCLEKMSEEMDLILNQIDIFITFVSKNEQMIYSIFKYAFEQFVKIKERSEIKDHNYIEDLLLLKEYSMIDEEKIENLNKLIENIENQKKCIILKIIESCSNKINLSVFKSQEIFNLIYHILEQYDSDSEIIELAINCLGFSIINYQELLNLVEENKNIIVKLYKLVNILENYEGSIEVSKEIKSKLLQILTLKEITEEKLKIENKISKEEDQLLNMINGYLKSCNIQKYNDNFEKSYSLFLIFNNIKVFKNKNLSYKTIKLLFDILIDNLKNIDTYLSEISIKIISILVDFDINFVLNLLFEQMKSINLNNEKDSQSISLQSQFLSKIIEVLNKIVRRYKSASSIFINKMFDIIIYFLQHLLDKLDRIHITGLFILLSNIVNFCGIYLHTYLDMIVRTSLNFLNNFKSYDIETRTSSAIVLFKIIQNCDFNHYSNHAKSIYLSIKLNYESITHNKENKIFKYHLKKSLDLIKENVKEFYLPSIKNENLEINLLINKDN